MALPLSFAWSNIDQSPIVEGLSLYIFDQNPVTQHTLSAESQEYFQPYKKDLSLLAPI